MTPISLNYFPKFIEWHIHIRDPASWKAFQEMVQRATNLWPDAPPEIKEFADLVTNGRIMQDYRKQVNQPKTGE